ncbi:ChbG/HpnK family deacetylase [Desulfohalovibrio reitneri]|uniref:ChbG/HpnK family deacetylase n=1 Tax=Desulfohalovibrio reitneri TaxID=1307759 RepID=UPI0004A76E26|nr:ChbG/HpnK family deacetylase [Desulfohalovibrio reitneri]
MKRFLVNADDVGLSEGICRAVADLLEAGAISSATAMACASGSLERIRAYKSGLAGRCGVHLQLTGGRGLVERKRGAGLVDASGFFPLRPEELGTPRPEAVEREWEAQIDAVAEALGASPTHLDSHHHVHFRSDLLPVALRLARRFGLPLRVCDADMAARAGLAGVPSPQGCLTAWFGPGASPERLEPVIAEGLNGIKDGQALELMCHPGFAPEELEGVSSYREERVRETHALAQADMPALARRFEAVLVGFAELDPLEGAA